MLLTRIQEFPIPNKISIWYNPFHNFSCPNLLLTFNLNLKLTTSIFMDLLIHVGNKFIQKHFLSRKRHVSIVNKGHGMKTKIIYSEFHLQALHCRHFWPSIQHAHKIYTYGSYMVISIWKVRAGHYFREEINNNKYLNFVLFCPGNKFINSWSSDTYISLRLIRFVY